MHQIPITPRQKEMLDAIMRLTAARGGIGPSYEELAIELGVTCGAVMGTAKRLAARGWLKRTPHLARTLQVIKEGGSQHKPPLR
jgi:DNA-binding MarR family transcriptional regulator